MHRGFECQWITKTAEPVDNNWKARVSLEKECANKLARYWLERREGRRMLLRLSRARRVRTCVVHGKLASILVFRIERSDGRSMCDCRLTKWGHGAGCASRANEARHLRWEALLAEVRTFW